MLTFSPIFSIIVVGKNYTRTTTKGYKTMKKYYVIINKCDSTKNKMVEGMIIGEFDNFMNASLFANAYENYYSSSTKIVEVKL